MAYLHLTLAHSKGQGQGHALFGNGYIGNSLRVRITIAIKLQFMYGLSMGIHQIAIPTLLFDLYLILVHLKDKVNVIQISQVNIYEIVKNMEHITIVID